MNDTMDTRGALLEAARALFANQGYDGTSIKEITTQARANLGAVTYHFGSKETLYNEALRTLTTPLSKQLAELQSDHRVPLERIETFMRGYFTHLAANPELPALLLQELALHRPIPLPFREVMRPLFGLLTENIAEGQRDGSIVEGDPILLAVSVISQPAYVLVMRDALREIAGVRIEDPEVRNRVLEHIVAVTRRNLTRPAAGVPGHERKAGD
jgi:AcrR family transcriptional regulator